jgi:hypothetical protein
MTSEKKRASARAWQKAHRQKCAAKSRAYYAAHREKCRDRQRKYREQHRDKCNTASRIYNRRARVDNKRKVIMLYGKVCACCGESRMEFLGIDHIKGGGTRHRRQCGGNVYIPILQEPYNPKKYRVLCWNCNLSLGFYGYCPHHPEIRQMQSAPIDIAESLPLFDLAEAP